MKRRRSAAHTKAEFARSFGSEARVEWVRSLACLGCAYRPSENAHIASGGTSRRADACFIVPLCGPHQGYGGGLVEGCHARLHRLGIKTFEAQHGLALNEEAQIIDRLWRQREAKG